MPNSRKRSAAQVRIRQGSPDNMGPSGPLEILTGRPLFRWMVLGAILFGGITGSQIKGVVDSQRALASQKTIETLKSQMLSLQQRNREADLAINHLVLQSDANAKELDACNAQMALGGKKHTAQVKSRKNGQKK